MPASGDNRELLVRACANNHKIPQLSGVCSVVLRYIFNLFVRDNTRKTMANPQVSATADPKIKEIITSLDDDKIGKPIYYAFARTGIFKF